MPHETRQFEADEQMASWLHKLDEQQALLNHWKIGADKLDRSRRMEVLTHIQSVESKIEHVRELLQGSTSNLPNDHSDPASRHVVGTTNETGSKEVLKQGISRALGDLGRALRKASERLSKH